MNREDYNPSATDLDKKIKETTTWLEDLLKRDRTVDRTDTGLAVIQAMDQIKGFMEKALSTQENIKESSYWALLNGTIEIFKY